MRRDVYVDSFGHDGGGGRSGGVDQVCRAIGRVTIIIIILNNTNNAFIIWQQTPSISIVLILRG